MRLPSTPKHNGLKDRGYFPLFTAWRPGPAAQPPCSQDLSHMSDRDAGHRHRTQRHRRDRPARRPASNCRRAAGEPGCDTGITTMMMQSSTAALRTVVPTDLAALKIRQQETWSPARRRRRHTASDRGRGTLPASAEGQWRARRRGRQRQRHAGRTPLRRGDVDRLCAGATHCGQNAPSPAPRSPSARPTPRRCRFRTPPSTSLVDVRACSRRTINAARDDARLPAGRTIGMANWTPGGFVGQIFRPLRRPRASRAPALWGTREYLSDLFAHDARRIDTKTRRFTFLPVGRAGWNTGPVRPDAEGCRGGAERQAALTTEISRARGAVQRGDRRTWRCRASTSR